MSPPMGAQPEKEDPGRGKDNDRGKLARGRGGQQPRRKDTEANSKCRDMGNDGWISMPLED